ncbi:hypothetical protein KCH_55800 [Kitasatospora cheerisanensis KCTC 2395]|uniref:Uncharacterized protein n=1 Tax=Kitasatospora cheerisanensis KCTC 2395 TaxID=1348663 RepID=A0A066YXN3_9ACTN|nr:hypothetical protein KCH_55800 [Kitasatospora cheerisanensis KCTC 2395]
MPVPHLLHGVHGQDPGRVHGPLVQLAPLEYVRRRAHPDSGLLPIL